MIRHTLAAAAWIAMSMGTIGAEQIRWDALYAQLSSQRPFCGDRVIGFTRDGRMYHAEDFCIAPDRPRLDCGGQDAPASEDVVRIEVRGGQRFLNFPVSSALLPGAAAAAIVIRSGLSAHSRCCRRCGRFSAVSAPVTLSMDAVSHLLPARIFEIVQ
jgi:hypothetical protein